jgi:hypothetical protein
MKKMKFKAFSTKNEEGFLSFYDSPSWRNTGMVIAKGTYACSIKAFVIIFFSLAGVS